MDVIFFNNKINKFFENLDTSLKSRADQMLHMLKLLGYNLKMPYSRPLGKGLFELRVIGETHIRFFYAFCDDRVWILHGFIKKTNKTPKKELDYARKQLKILLQ